MVVLPGTFRGSHRMTVPVASTCYWETDPPTYVDTGGSGYSGRLNDLLGAVSRWRSRDEGTGFEASLQRNSLLSLGSEPEILYRGRASRRRPPPSTRDSTGSSTSRAMSRVPATTCRPGSTRTP